MPNKYNLDQVILDLEGNPVMSKGRQVLLEAPKEIITRDGKTETIETGGIYEEKLTYRSAIRNTLLSKGEGEENNDKRVTLAFKLVADTGAVELDNTEKETIISAAKKYTSPVVYGRIKRFFDNNEGLVIDEDEPEKEKAKKKDKS